MTEDCATCPANAALAQMGVDVSDFDYLVALAGNPNTGKTTLFNRLSGLRAKTSNFPGTTLEARITRVQATPKALIMHTVNAVGDAISPRTAAAFVSNLLDADAVDERTATLILTAVSDNALRPIAPEHRDIVRASIFKQLLVAVLTDTDGDA